MAKTALMSPDGNMQKGIIVKIAAISQFAGICHRKTGHVFHKRIGHSPPCLWSSITRTRKAGLQLGWIVIKKEKCCNIWGLPCSANRCLGAACCIKDKRWMCETHIKWASYRFHICFPSVFHKGRENNPRGFPQKCGFSRDEKNLLFLLVWRETGGTQQRAQFMWFV